MMPSSQYYSDLTDRHAGILTQAEQKISADALIVVAERGQVYHTSVMYCTGVRLKSGIGVYDSLTIF